MTPGVWRLIPSPAPPWAIPSFFPCWSLPSCSASPRKWACAWPWSPAAVWQIWSASASECAFLSSSLGLCWSPTWALWPWNFPPLRPPVWCWIYRFILLSWSLWCCFCWWWSAGTTNSLRESCWSPVCSTSPTSSLLSKPILTGRWPSATFFTPTE